MAKKKPVKKSSKVTKKVVKKVAVKRVIPKTVEEAKQIGGERPMKTQQKKVQFTFGSPQQHEIWEAMLWGNAHLMVRARAGTGKTFTMIEGLKYMKEAGRLPKYTTFAAFNRAIAEELKEKVPEGVKASTLHGLGFRACRYALGNPTNDDERATPNEDKMTEMVKIATVVFPVDGGNKRWNNVSQAAVKLAGLCKNTLSGEVFEEDDEWYFTVVPEVLDQLCERYAVDIEDEDRKLVYNLVEQSMCFALQDDSTFDLDDMIWLPVVKDLKVFQSDLLVVDEFQDMNACQHAFIQKAGRRIICVGDEYQGIYAFRGADAHSMDNFLTILQTHLRGVYEKKLTVSWRLPKSHAKLAQEVVPDIEAAPKAIQGMVEEARYEQMRFHVEPGQMVVCRTNAPLVSLAFTLMQDEKPVRIQGRDIGANLVKLIHSLTTVDDSSILKSNLNTYYSHRMAGLEQNRDRNYRAIQVLNDTYYVLQAFIKKYNSVRMIIAEINRLFVSIKEADPERYIRLGSVHQIKGLEADTVWVYGPEEMPHPMARTDEDKEQEWNIWYVAHTRSKRLMCLVPLPKRED